MTLAIVSDAHENSVYRQRFLNALPPVHGVCFLGDCIADGMALREGLGHRQSDAMYHAVLGNNDFCGADPYELTFRCGGKKFLMVHGHRQRVKTQLDLLSYRARELEVDAAFYGHTHVAAAEYAHGILLFNPGALCRGAYGLIILSKGDLRFEHHVLPAY